MGLEATCKVTHKRKTFEAAVHVEGDHILIRGTDVRLKLSTAGLKSVTAEGGALVLDSEAEGVVKLAVGAAAAEKWRDKILHPPTRMDKLGLKPGMTYWSKGEFDAEFLRHLNPALAKPASQADMLFFEASSPADLEKAAEAGKKMSPKSAIWIVFPKGKQTPVPQDDVFRVMRGAGLTDNKVCAFNEKLSALKFVVPKAKR